MGKQLMAPGSWDPGETGGVACCKLEHAEKGRYDFEKTKTKL